MKRICQRQASQSDGKFILSLWIMLALSVLFPLAAKADVAVPTLLFIWPASWALLLAIIPIEYVIAKKILGLSHKRSFLLSLTANAISSAAGIPIAWIIMAVGTVVTQLSVYSLWKNAGSTGWYDAIVQVTGQTVFLVPGGVPIETYFHKCIWIVPVVTLFLLLPYFFASVWIEKLVAERFVKNRQKASTWSWTANSASYGLIVVVLTCFLLGRAIQGSSLTFLEGNISGMAGVDVYAFSKEQIDPRLVREIINGRQGESWKSYGELPFAHALVHTKSGPSSCHFYLSLPKHGDFFIASNYQGYQSDANGHISTRQYFWLIPVQTNGETTVKLELTNQNMVDPINLVKH